MTAPKTKPLRRPPARGIRLLKKTRGLEESRVFNEVDLRLRLKNSLRRNVYTIVSYALTEMVNNAIEHSKSKKVALRVGISPGGLRFFVKDWGNGAYRNVQTKFRLESEFAAMEHLFKGKQTTDPKRHSGEGIFFTSRIADRFMLRSHGIRVTFDNLLGDTFVQEPRYLKGTEVFFEIKRLSRKSLSDLFRKFSSGVTFDRSEVRVKLTVDEGLLSRSQGRRLVAGLEKFRRIAFDFKGVKEVGQGFVDEIFRVFATSHPKIKLTYTHAVPGVRFMIRRAAPR